MNTDDCFKTQGISIPVRASSFQPSETAPEGSPRFSNVMSLPLTKTPSPCQRQSRTPQTALAEVAATNRRAITSSLDTAGGPGQGAVDKSLKDVAAEVPQCNTKTVSDVEHCQQTQLQTVDRLSTCKTGCVGNSFTGGLGYIDKSSVNVSGCVDKSATGVSGCVDEPAVGVSRDPYVGKPLQGKPGYVDRPITGESGCAEKSATSYPGCVEKSPTGELGHVEKLATGNSGHLEKPSTCDPGYIEKPSTGTGEPSCVDKPPSADLGYEEKLATGDPGYVEKPATGDPGYVEKPATGNPGYVEKPATGDSGFIEKQSTDESGYAEKPATSEPEYMDKPPTGDPGCIDNPPTGDRGYEEKPATGVPEYFKLSHHPGGVSSTEVQRSDAPGNVQVVTSSGCPHQAGRFEASPASSTGYVWTTTQDSCTRTSSDNVWAVEDGVTAFVKSTRSRRDPFRCEDEDDGTYFENGEREPRTVTPPSNFSSHLPPPGLSNSHGGKSYVTVCGKDHVPSSLQSHNAVFGTASYTKVTGDHRSRDFDPEGSGTSEEEHDDTDITGEISSSGPNQGGDMTDSLESYMKITSAAVEQESNTRTANHQAASHDRSQQRNTTCDACTSSRPFSNLNHKQSITLCPDIEQNKLCCYVYGKEEHNTQTPDVQSEMPGHISNILDTEADDISEFMPAGVKPSLSRDPTMISATDGLSWIRDHARSLPYPVENDVELKLVSQFSNRDCSTERLTSLTNLPFKETDQWSDHTLPEVSGLSETSFAEPTPYVRIESDSATRRSDTDSFPTDALKLFPKPGDGVLGWTVPTEADIPRDTLQENTGVDLPLLIEPGVSRDTRQEDTGVVLSFLTQPVVSTDLQQEDTGVDLAVLTKPVVSTDLKQEDTGVDSPVLADPHVPRDIRQEGTRVDVSVLTEPGVLRDAEAETTRQQPARSPQQADLFPDTCVRFCEREQSDVLKQRHSFENSLSPPVSTSAQTGPILIQQIENSAVPAPAFARLSTDTLPGVSTSNSYLPLKDPSHIDYVPWSTFPSPPQRFLQPSISSDSGYSSQEIDAN